MSSISQHPSTATTSQAAAARDNESRVTGWWVFAGIMLGILGTLNVIWGIAAISNAKFFVNGAKYVISDLKTWGWVVLIFGVCELIAAFSLFAGGSFGRWFGVFCASVTSLLAVITLPAYPFWSLMVFALAVIVIYQLAKDPQASL